jgi:CBS domain-containing protein
MLLKAKGHEIFTIPAGTPVLKALEMMAEKNIGALLVMDKGLPAGIFSERDFARHAAEKKTANLAVLVDEFMTTEVVCVSPDETMDEVMAIMTNKRIRHLPVCDQGKLVGIFSIGDVVKTEIEDKDLLIKSQENYILGRGFGE